MTRLAGIGLLVVFVAVAAAGAAWADDEGGWRSLFDGKDLAGWRQHGGKAVYTVEDGAVVGQSVPNTPNSFLCTKETFKDFELLFEVKVDRGLNSGVQVRSNVKENDRVFGPQVEITASPGPSGYIYGEATGRGWLCQERPKNNLLKNDEWNEFRVLCRGDRIQTWINGEPVADLVDPESNREGLIGLQVHGVGKKEEPMYVRWRNIKIRPVKQAEP
jgi:hypothetical protein